MFSSFIFLFLYFPMPNPSYDELLYCNYVDFLLGAHSASKKSHYYLVEQNAYFTDKRARQAMKTPRRILHK